MLQNYKKKATKRTMEVNINENKEENQKEENTKKETDISIHNNFLKIKGILRSENTATFIDPEDNFFYNYLNYKCKAHKNFIGESRISQTGYYQPFTISGFKFKPSNKIGILFKNKCGLVVDYLELIDKKCAFIIRIVPYDYINNVGLSLKVSEIKEIV